MEIERRSFMALVQFNFESQYLQGNTNVNIILPDKPREIGPREFYSNGKKYKVLWLLHGTFGGYDDWMRKSNIELYACEHDLIVVMPGIGNSDYTNWDNFGLGYDAENFIVSELMPLVHAWFPASDKKEDNFIAGLSMGGEGTLYLALKYPELFAKAAVMSFIPFKYDKKKLEELYGKTKKEVYGNSTDVLHSQKRQYNQLIRYDSVDEFLDTPFNLYDYIAKVDKTKIPDLLFTCGTEDPLFPKEHVEEFKKHLNELGIDAKFSSGKGSHEWRVWDRDIQIALEFFGISGKAQGNAF